MTRTLLRQAWCLDITDHSAHIVYRAGAGVDPHGEYATYCTPLFRCPGRHTPSRYRAPDPQPEPGWTDDDPFAGLDD
jgi:hypothetical protein